MTKIKYFTGKEVIEVELTEIQAEAFKECRREEWRADKHAERYQSALSFDHMDEERDDGKVNDLIKQQREPDSALVVKDYLTEMVEADDAFERNSKIRAVLNDLTPEQKSLVRMLMRGLSVTEIAKQLGVGKSAVSNMRIRIQENFKKVLK
jgi:DNA-binding NarL/FixJ family response regulator